MAGTHLATYLNDHLAGSVVAIEMLEHLERTHKGTPLASFAFGLRAEIVEDRQTLERLMERLEIAKSPVRQAAAWLSEKLSEVKLKVEDMRGDRLRLLEILDALSLGIEGKRLLWIALGAVARIAPDLGGNDYNRLEQRAEEQRRVVETHRLEAARSALAEVPTA